nr:hypothetical protein BaRGS_000270 [Batillaria attramentaria]
MGEVEKEDRLALAAVSDATWHVHHHQSTEMKSGDDTPTDRASARKVVEEDVGGFVYTLISKKANEILSRFLVPIRLAF